MKPAAKPSRPHFSSGPCAKPRTWSPAGLSRAVVGRYHRSAPARARLRELAEKTRALLRIPESHAILILPGSDTGAVEAAMWNLLGPRGVDILAFDHFGHEWAKDVAEQLRLADSRTLAAAYGDIPDLRHVDFARDLVFAWTGTTAGTCVPGGEWIARDRLGLTICDATSAVFAVDLPWDRLDAAAFSWQKAMGGEAQHGILVLGPRAAERLASHVPSWPIPKLFRIAKDGGLDPALLEGGVINTPSLLCVEDALFSLTWIESEGGLEGMIARACANRALLDAWIEKSSFVAQLARDPKTRPPTPVTMRFCGSLEGLTEADTRRFAAEIAGLLEGENVAFDIEAYRRAPPGLRVWTGGTVESRDVALLLPWLDWAAEAVFAR